MDNFITLEDAYQHLARNIADADGKQIIVELMQFVMEWNVQNPPHKIFTYTREDVNIGFAPDIKNNKEKARKPNFLVIKLAHTETEIKQLHLDFDFGLQPSPPPMELQPYLLSRPSRAKTNRPRWIVTRDTLQTMGLERLKQLFLVAYDRRQEDCTKKKKKPAQERV